MGCGGSKAHQHQHHHGQPKTTMVVDGRVGGLRGPTTYATVEAQLLTKKGFLRFREFCITDYSTENIDFWKRVKDYKNTFNPLHDYSPDGKAIYDEFVCIIAPRQINIPAAILESIGHAIIGGKYLSDTFDEAFNEVFGLLKSDIFPRFKLQDHVTVANADGSPDGVGLGLSASPHAV